MRQGAVSPLRRPAATLPGRLATHATLDHRTEVNVAGWVQYLTARGLGPNGPAPIRPLHRGPAHDVLRIGRAVVKAVRPGHANPERTQGLIDGHDRLPVVAAATRKVWS